MGYQRDKLLKLAFEEDHELHGLEVQIRPAKMRLITEVSKLDKSKDSVSGLLCEPCQSGNSFLHKEDEDYQECQGGLLESLANYLHSWNLEDENSEPCPPNLESLLDQDIEFILYLMEAWVDATGSVPENLRRKSSDGEAFQEELTNVDILSQSQEPLVKPNLS